MWSGTSPQLSAMVAIVAKSIHSLYAILPPLAIDRLRIKLEPGDISEKVSSLTMACS
jgi:hypothetical protein